MLTPEEFSRLSYIERTQSRLHAMLAMWPKTIEFLRDEEEPLRGITLTHSQSGEWLLILKKYDADGNQLVAFRSVMDPTALFIDLDTVLGQVNWKRDKWKPSDKK